MDTQKNIMASIVAILTNNGLTELSLGDYDELHDPAYIVWLQKIADPVFLGSMMMEVPMMTPLSRSW